MNLLIDPTTSSDPTAATWTRRAGRAFSRRRGGRIIGAGEAATHAQETWLPSHRGLLTPVDPPVGTSSAKAAPDLIVVPTAYSQVLPGRGLLLAFELARQGTPLVIMCSKGAATKDSIDALAAHLRGAAVDDALVLVTAPSSALTTFAVDDLEVSKAWRRGGSLSVTEPRLAPANDVGRKRNLAVAYAVSLGLSEILFLDDDVFVASREPEVVAAHPRTLNPIRLAAAVSALRADRLGAVGWTARDFDDNSVLHRIRSEMDLGQSQFIGAGALLADVSTSTPFFPAIYSEDWLFLLGVMRQRGWRSALGEAGDVHQERRQPYSARRAASEELGDLLCEGLLTRVGRDDFDLAAAHDYSFWMEAFEARCRHRDQLDACVRDSRNEDKAAMLDSLAVIAKVQRQVARDGYVLVKEMADYMHTWDRDLGEWHQRLVALGRQGPAAFATSCEARAVVRLGERFPGFPLR